MNIPNKYTIVANLFTVFNGLAGILGIIIAIFYSETLPYVPFQLMIFGEIFDFLDGFNSRRLFIAFNERVKLRITQFLD